MRQCGRIWSALWNQKGSRVSCYEYNMYHFYVEKKSRPNTRWNIRTYVHGMSASRLFTASAMTVHEWGICSSSSLSTHQEMEIVGSAWPHQSRLLLLLIPKKKALLFLSSILLLPIDYSAFIEFISSYLSLFSRPLSASPTPSAKLCTIHRLNSFCCDSNF